MSPASTADIRQRNESINPHLLRLESHLAHSKRSVESLRELLGPTSGGGNREEPQVP